MLSSANIVHLVLARIKGAPEGIKAMFTMMNERRLGASIAQADPPTDPRSQQANSVVKTLAQALHPWPQLVQQVGMRALQDHDEVGAAAYDFLMYSGYVCLAYFWLRMAHDAGADGLDVDPRFLSAKQKTATFYFDRLLPRAQFHKVAMQTGKSDLAVIWSPGRLRA